MIKANEIVPKLNDQDNVIKTNFDGQINIYFKPNLFSYGRLNVGAKVDDAHVYSVTSLFVDLDMGATDHQEGLKKVYKKIDKLGLPLPQAVWDTGHGIDMLWRIKAGYVGSDSFKGYYEAVLKSLAKVLPYADPQVTAISNFLRVPNTTNDKRYKDLDVVSGNWVSFHPDLPDTSLNEMATLLNVAEPKELTNANKTSIEAKKEAVEFRIANPDYVPKSKGTGNKAGYDGIKINYGANDTPAQKAYKRHILHDIKLYILERNMSKLNVHRYALLMKVRQFGGETKYFNDLLADPLTGYRWKLLNEHEFNGVIMPKVAELLDIMEPTQEEMKQFRIIKTPELAKNNAELKAIRRKLKPALTKLTKQFQGIYVKRSRGTNASIAKALGISVRSVQRLKEGGINLDNDKLVQLMNLCAQLILKDVKAGGTVDTAKVDDLITTLNEINTVSRHNQKGLLTTISQLNEVKQMIA